MNLQKAVFDWIPKRQATVALTAGDNARDEGRWVDAVSAYKKYLELEPQAAAIWVQLGHCQKEAGNPTAAEQAYLKSLELNPKNPDVLLHLGRLKQAANEPAAAEDYLRRATQLPSPTTDAANELESLVTKSLRVFLLAGDEARDEKRWADAVEGYSKYLELRPGDAPIWVQLGHCQKENGDLAAAEESYQKNLALNPENPDALLHLGRVELSRNNAAVAEDYFQRAAAFPSPTSDAAKELDSLKAAACANYLSSADKAFDEQRWPDAVANLKKYLELTPSAANIWVRLGKACNECADYSGAEGACEKALELRPDDTDALLNLGRAKRSLGDWSAADTCFQRAAALPSPSQEAAKEARALRFDLERLLSGAEKSQDDKRWPDAIGAYRKYVGFQPNSGSVWARLGRCLSENGDAVEAEKALLESRRLGFEVPKDVVDVPKDVEIPDDVVRPPLAAPGTLVKLYNRCKICGSRSTLQFGLPFNKKANHPIPNEPDDCWYYQCDNCQFLYTRAIDDHVQEAIYDETYWNNQDPDWYGRVSQTLRLCELSNELLRGRLDAFDILDFGCGIGGFVEVGRNSLSMNVWGTDIIPPKVGKEYFLPNPGSKRFDIITACEVIEHLPDPVSVISKAITWLKRPGVFAFQTGLWDPAALDRSWWYLGPHNGHISLYSAGAFDHLFKKLGGAERRDWREYKGLQAWLFT